MPHANLIPVEPRHGAAPVAPDLGALKLRQQAAWSSGDYAIVGTTLQIVGEALCEALDLRAGRNVLDVAAGNGVASLAAARRWCEVVSIGLCAEPVGARPRAGLGRGPRYRIQGGRRRGAALRRRRLRHGRLDLRRHVRARPGQGRGRASARLQIRRPDRSRQLDAGRLHRAVVQDARHLLAAGRGRPLAHALGHARAPRRDVRFRGERDPHRAALLQFPLSLAATFPRRVQDLLWPDAQGFHRARREQADLPERGSARR